jgi:hypothetical protein
VSVQIKWWNPSHGSKATTTTVGARRKKELGSVRVSENQPKWFFYQSQNNKHEASTISDQSVVRLGKRMMRRIVEDSRHTTTA